MAPPKITLSMGQGAPSPSWVTATSPFSASLAFSACPLSRGSCHVHESHWAHGDNLCPAASAWASLAQPVPAVTRLTPAGTSMGWSPTPLGDVRGSQLHSHPWEEASCWKDPVINHLHVLAQFPMGAVSCHGRRFGGGTDLSTARGCEDLGTCAQGCPFPCRYMVDAADQEKIEASKNELHNLLDKPQLQGIPVSWCLSRSRGGDCQGLQSRFREGFPFLGGVASLLHS